MINLRSLNDDVCLVNTSNTHTLAQPVCGAGKTARLLTMNSPEKLHMHTKSVQMTWPKGRNYTEGAVFDARAVLWHQQQAGGIWRYAALTHYSSRPSHIIMKTRE